MAYIGKTPSQAVRSRYFYTASGGETSFSGADDNGNSLVYTDGNYVDVYLNGVLLVAGADYNTNTTNTVAGITAVAASDIVEIVVYDTFSVFGGDVLGDFTISNGNFTANSLIYPTTDGTSGQFLTTDGSGNLSFATVNTNLVADLTPQLGGTLDANGNSIDMGTYTITDAKVGQWDTAYGWGDHSTQNYAVTTGDTMTGNLDFGDNVYARFGASNDLKIFHTGSSSNIQDSGTGNLNISGDDVVILNAAATETKATFASNGAVTLYYDNNAKIATTNTGVDVTGTVTADGLTVDAGGSRSYFNSSHIRLSDDYNLEWGGGTNYVRGSNASNYLLFATNSSEAMRIDGSGNVGIGTTAPSQKLQVAGSVAANNYFFAPSAATIGTASDTSIEMRTSADATPAMIFRANGSTERMRVDSSGDLLVGKTSSSFSTAGLSLRGNVDAAQFTRSGGPALEVNRLSTDGEIAGFYKDTVKVGSIGVNTDRIYLTGANEGIALDDSLNEIFPCNNAGNTLDDTVILGGSNRRFKDLYLSGGVYLGGTGSSNLLSDYEEGTCTITADAATTSPTSPSTQTGYYTKIGNMVTVWCDLNNIDMAGGAGNLRITGLPFGPSGNAGNKVGPAYTNNFLFQNTSVEQTVVVETAGAGIDWLNLRVCRSDNNAATLVTATSGHINNGVTDVRFTICYKVN